MTKDTPERMHQRAAVKAERFKMLAGGTQLIAVGVLGASVIAPVFNNAQRFSVLLASAGGAAAALIELVAWWLLGYAVPHRRTSMPELFLGLVAAGVPFVVVLSLGIYIEQRWSARRSK